MCYSYIISLYLQVFIKSIKHAYLLKNALIYKQLALQVQCSSGEVKGHRSKEVVDRRSGHWLHLLRHVRRLCTGILVNSH